MMHGRPLSREATPAVLRQREYGRGYYIANLEERRAYSRTYSRKRRAANPEASRLSLEALRKRPERPASKLARTNRFRAKLRTDIFAAYGNACACCGETDRAFLTLDHIARDGAAHRKRLGGRSGYLAVYADIRRQGYPRDRFRLFCMNRNWASRFGDECPHVARREAVRDVSEVHLHTGLGDAM